MNNISFSSLSSLVFFMRSVKLTQEVEGTGGWIQHFPSFHCQQGLVMLLLQLLKKRIK